MNSIKLITREELYKFSMKQDFSMLLTGLPGTGKTHWLESLAKTVDKTKTRMWTQNDLTGKWCRESNWDSVDFENRVDLEWTYGSGFLIIDDFGSMHGKVNHYGNEIQPLDFILEAVYVVWRRRQKAGLRSNIIITTNYGKTHLEEILGDRAYSRLVEMCPHYILDSTVDLRMLPAKERGLEINRM